MVFGPASTRTSATWPMGTRAPARGVDEGAADRLDRLPGGVVQAHDDVVASLLLEHLGGDVAAEGGLDGLREVLRAKADRRRCAPVEIDLDLGDSDLRLDEQVHDPGNWPSRRGSRPPSSSGCRGRDRRA